MTWRHAPHAVALPGLLALSLLAASCGESTASLAGEDGENSAAANAHAGEDAHGLEPGMEYKEIVSKDAIAQAAASAGFIEFRAEDPFIAVLLHITSFERYDLEYAYERADGTISDYSPVEPEEPEYTSTTATLKLPEQAVALRVKLREGEGAVKYLGARFFAELPPGGVLDTHMHDPDPVAEGLVESDVEYLKTTAQAAARSGRYIPPADIIARGREQYVAYEGAPRWDPSNCGGSFLSGTRALAEHLMQRFPSATHYGGYSCRANTANTSRMSVHGTGRAIDLHVRRVNGDADNDAGDPIANWLIANAEAIGITYFIWDRTSWGASRGGDKHRRYTGPSPHTDHLHIEISSEGARMRTPWFRDQSTAIDVPGSDGGADDDPGLAYQNEGVTCRSSTLGRRVPSGDCVQMAYYKYGSRCNWARCTESGTWTRVAPDACPSTPHSNSSCQGVNQPSDRPTTIDEEACHSRTLGQMVEHGACVQVNYTGRTCSQCGWYACNDGAWVCTQEGDCGGQKYGHTDCGAVANAGDSGLTLTLEWEDEVDLDLFVREPSGATLSYSTNAISTNDGYHDNEGSCRSSDCSSLPKPFQETVTWGERSGRVTPGTYTFWVQNYDGRAPASFNVQVEQTDEDGEVVFEQSYDFSLPAERRASTEEVSFEISN